MKKILYLIMFVLLSTQSFAICDYGVIEIGRNGRRYCRCKGKDDKYRLAFFAGQTWCYAQGLEPTTVHTACDYDATEKWNPNFPTICPNFNNWKSLRNASNKQHDSGSRAVATLNVNGSGEVYRVNFNNNNTDGVIGDNVTGDVLGWFWCDLPN